MRKFAVALNCIDGRTHLPLFRWVRKNHGVEYLDLVTKPGMVAFLADEGYSLKNILKQIDISVEKHSSSQVFIAGHYDCAGNPVDDRSQAEQILCSVERVKRVRPGLDVFGLWIDKRWRVSKVI